MNKKFKLTDKVTKESIRSPEFKRWLKVVLAAVCIFSLIFQLSTCVFTGLNVYAAEDDSVIGTWVFSTPVPVLLDTVYNFDITGTITVNEVSSPTAIHDNLIIVPLNKITVTNSGFYFYSNIDYPSYFISCTSAGYYSAGKYDSSSSNIGASIDFDNINNYSFTIDGGADVNNETFKTWLRSVASKQVITVHDFTNEIRQFNDNLTFFITDSAVWSESFSFNFEVLGVGTAYSIDLERGNNNHYIMSYNFSVDGSIYLQEVYDFHYPTQSGGFIRENYKLIRFINNPENTDFQQWLLDNTTLVGTVDDAPTFDSIYETGFNVGYNAGYEQGFANSLIGDSLSGPINALSSITLIQIGDVEITLGGVVMTAIALCLVLAFLKLYAGG